MAVGFVIKKFYENGTSGYFQSEIMIDDLFISNIYLAWVFNKYEDAEKKIETMEGLFQIEKIFHN